MEKEIIISMYENSIFDYLTDEYGLKDRYKAQSDILYEVLNIAFKID